MKRFVSIWLPRWPVDRLRRTRPAAVPAEPFALTATSGNAVRLTAVNDAAAANGLCPDMMLTDARSMAPGLLTAPAEPGQDARALTRLARWLTRYSPWANVDGADGVLLDVTGCAHLFSGEAGLLADMERRLTDFGFTHRAGLADTPGAAWALARYGAAPVAPPGGAAAALAGLPVEGLRLDADSVTLLKRLGLKRIGQLYDFPRASLARRFRSAEKRAALMDRLDRTLGRVAEPVSPLAPVADHRAGLSLAEPVQDVEAVARIVSRLAEDLCGALKEAGLGAQRLTLDAFRVDGALARLSAGASRPTQDPRHIERLFAEHIEEIDAGFGIDRVVLGAPRVARLNARQSALAPEAEGAVDAESLARLIDRLAARFGEDAVQCLAPRDSHIPERAERAAGALAGGFFEAPHPPSPRLRRAGLPTALTRRGPLPLPAGEGSAARPGASSPLPRERSALRSPRAKQGRVRGADDNAPPRPFLLFERPEPVAVMAQIPDGPPLRFRWRRVLREVVRAEGPERIAPEWWLVGSTDDTRDYYRVEDRAGRRYWLYREGLYSGAEAPRWFVHGVFG